MTPEEVQILIDTNLADASNITPIEHRQVETELLNLIKKVPTQLVLDLDTFTSNRNYSLNTGLTGVVKITGAYAMLECRVPNNSFQVGDCVTSPTPYPTDSGRTAEQGIGVQYNNSSPDVVRITVSDQITIKSAYNSTGGSSSDILILSGSATGNWRIKVFLTYVYL